MPDILYNEPTKLRAGLTWAWRRKLDDYPAGTWTLKYWLKTAAAHIEIVASASGTEHAVSVSAATTQGYAAATYQWVATVEDVGGNRYEIDRGALEVEPRIDQAAALDLRSDTRKIYDALQAAYLDFTTNRAAVKSYAIGDRQMTFASAKEIREELAIWKGKLIAEQQAELRRNGLAPGNKLHVKLA